MLPFVFTDSERAGREELAVLLGWGWMSDVGLHQAGFVPKDKTKVLVQPQTFHCQSDRLPAGSFLTFLPILCVNEWSGSSGSSR